MLLSVDVFGLKVDVLKVDVVEVVQMGWPVLSRVRSNTYVKKKIAKQFSKKKFYGSATSIPIKKKPEG